MCGKWLASERVETDRPRTGIFINQLEMSNNYLFSSSALLFYEKIYHFCKKKTKKKVDVGDFFFSSWFQTWSVPVWLLIPSCTPEG